MATLRIDQRTFEAEREVVKEERRWRYEDAPFGLLTEILYDHAYTVHPYKHSVIGSMADLEAASIDDVRDFFDTYYVPENATLVLVGDFDPERALAYIKLYFGRVPKAKRPVPRDIPREPPSTAERRVTLTQSENWPLPAVIVAHHITYDGHPDAYPLHIASKVLSDGESSRIYRRLVYEDRLAVSAAGDGLLIEDPNLFYAVSIVPAGARAGRVGGGADRGAGPAEDGADSRNGSCSGPRTSSPATTCSAASPSSRRPRTSSTRR